MARTVLSTLGRLELINDRSGGPAGGSARYSTVRAADGGSVVAPQLHGIRGTSVFLDEGGAPDLE